MSSNGITSHYFTTDDRVKLHYLKAGANNDNVLILLPGWSQTARLFQAQLQAFSATHRVIALDTRGHGESDKPASGYRLCRLARDLQDLIQHLGAPKVTVLGHSASCAVIWNYIEIFGDYRLEAAIFVDQMICYIKDSNWTPVECQKYGALSTADDIKTFCSALSGPDSTAETRSFLRNMFSDDLSDADFEMIVEENLKFPRPLAANMLWNVTSGDYRDLLSTVSIPVLCIGASDSLIPHECVRYMASEIPNAEHEILQGSHFMFYEDPASFNAVVGKFLQQERHTPVYRQRRASSCRIECAREAALVPDDVLC